MRAASFKGSWVTGLDNVHMKQNASPQVMRRGDRSKGSLPTRGSGAMESHLIEGWIDVLVEQSGTHEQPAECGVREDLSPGVHSQERVVQKR